MHRWGSSANRRRQVKNPPQQAPLTRRSKLQIPAAPTGSMGRGQELSASPSAPATLARTPKTGETPRYGGRSGGYCPTRPPHLGQRPAPWLVHRKARVEVLHWWRAGAASAWYDFAIAIGRTRFLAVGRTVGCTKAAQVNAAQNALTTPTPAERPMLIPCRLHHKPPGTQPCRPPLARTWAAVLGAVSDTKVKLKGPSFRISPNTTSTHKAPMDHQQRRQTHRKSLSCEGANDLGDWWRRPHRGAVVRRAVTREHGHGIQSRQNWVYASDLSSNRGSEEAAKPVKSAIKLFAGESRRMRGIGSGHSARLTPILSCSKQQRATWDRSIEGPR